jgi:hypothetical protein
MVLQSHKRRWFAAILTIVLAAMVVGGVVLNRYSDALSLKPLVESKALRDATVTVMRKERVRFDKTTDKYDEDSGYNVHQEAGTEDLLVYYRIDSFDPRDEPVSSRLFEIEKQRNAQGRWRHRTNSPEEYDGIKVGDIITVQYQRFRDDSILTW